MRIIVTIISLMFFCQNLVAEDIKVVPNEYIITYKNDQVARFRSSTFSPQRNLSKRKKSRRRIDLVRYQNLSSLNVESNETVYSKSHNLCPQILSENPQLASCIPNFRFRISQLPDDPFINECQGETCVCAAGFDIEIDDAAEGECLWGVNNSVDTDINAPEAWDLTTGNTETIIAVTDTGVDYEHADIAANMWVNPGEIPDNGIDDDLNGYIDDIHGITTALGYFNRGESIDDHGHGTHVAGIIGAVANNQTGIAGTSWNSKIMSVKILDASGGASGAEAIEAINYIVSMKEDFGQNIIAINASWGGDVPIGVLIGENGLIASIHAANDAGILFVAAAGNESSNIDIDAHYPASLTTDNMIAVASTNYLGRLSSFSNYGADSVHLAAPGSEVRSLLLSGSNFGDDQIDGTTVTSGTSMAAPYVSGILALMHDFFPELSPSQLKDRLLNRVKPLANINDANKLITGGMANAWYALTDDEIPVPSPLPEPSPSPSPSVSPSPSQVPSPSASASPSPSPSPVVQAQPGFDLVYHLDIFGKSRARFTRKLFETRAYKVNVSTIGFTTNSSETLSLYFKYKGQECPNPVITFDTDDNGNATLKGKFPKLGRKVKRGGFVLKDLNNQIQAERSAKISKAKLRRKLKRNKICNRVKLRS